jgi:hypothetical protein
MPSMARHRSDDCGSSADENVGRSARIHRPVVCCEPSFDGGPSFSLVAAPRRVEDDRLQLVMSSLDPMTNLILDPARSVD